MADSYYEAIQLSGLITGQGQIPLVSDSNGNIMKPPKIAYSAMHGVGHPWAVRLFESFNLDPFLTVPQQKDADPDFPSVPFPNPEEKGALNLSMEFASSNDCDIVLANDPDADRLAVAEKCRKSGNWTTFTGDQIGTMLGHWIWENVGKNSEKVREYTSNKTEVVQTLGGIEIFILKILIFMHAACRHVCINSLFKNVGSDCQG